MHIEEVGSVVTSCALYCVDCMFGDRNVNNVPSLACHCIRGEILRWLDCHC